MLNDFGIVVDVLNLSLSFIFILINKNVSFVAFNSL